MHEAYAALLCHYIIMPSKRGKLATGHLRADVLMLAPNGIQKGQKAQ